MSEVRPYRVLRDTREKKGWEFPAKDPCLGTIAATLKTGDYTLEGYEDIFVVERKLSTAEIALNLHQSRFVRELERLEKFAHPFLVCEFTLAEVINFPEGSGIPRSRWHELRLTPQYLLKKLNDWQVQFKTKLVFAGPYGREYCSSLFKRITEHVEPRPAS